MCSACSGSSPATVLLFGTPQGIVEYRTADGTQKLLLAPVGGDGAVARDPAVSPDGRRLAYVQALPGGDDLWVANRDGSDAHLASAHESAEERMRQPLWLDKQHLLAMVAPASDVMSGTTLDRIDAGTGERARVLNQITSFGVSPDGMRIVYAAAGGSGGPTLFTARSDGTDPKTIANGDERFVTFGSPRFAFDQKSIWYIGSAAGPQGQRLARVDLTSGSVVMFGELASMSAFAIAPDSAHAYVTDASAVYEFDLSASAKTPRSLAAIGIDGAIAAER